MRRTSSPRSKPGRPRACRSSTAAHRGRGPDGGRAGLWADEDDLLDARLAAFAAETRVPPQHRGQPGGLGLHHARHRGSRTRWWWHRTERAAPVWRGSIKAELEAPAAVVARLLITRIGRSFSDHCRPSGCPSGAGRRAFWSTTTLAWAAGPRSGVARRRWRRRRRSFSQTIDAKPKEGPRGLVGSGPGRPGPADGAGAAGAGCGRRGDPRPAGDARDPRPRAARGGDRGRGQGRASATARPRPRSTR
jgi:hypothetical protein